MTEQMEPKLRFKDKNNNDYPDWETKKLHQIIDVKDGTHESPKPTDDGYLLVTSKNLKNSTLDFSESYSISKEDYEDINKRSKVEIGDILFGMIGTIGNPILLEKDGFAIKNVALLKTSSLQEREYILNFLKSNSITKQFYKLNVGGTQKFISLRGIRDLKIDIPSSEEAIKIGGFFSKLDQQIELEEKKLELLEQQKKGYMQKIFSQQLRFKDEKGNDYPKWIFKKFEEIFKVVPSKKYQIKSSEIEDNASIPVIDQGQNLILGFSNNKEKVFNDFKNVIIYGDHTTVIKRSDKPFIIGGDGVKLLTSKVDSDISYLYNALQYFNVKSEGYKRHFSILKNKDFYISTSIEEQKRIANIFNKLDKYIEKQFAKVELLKQRKQGLLQKMFV